MLRGWRDMELRSFSCHLFRNAGGVAATPWVTMMLDDLEALWIAGLELQLLGSPEAGPCGLAQLCQGVPRAWKTACRSYRCLTIACLKNDDDTQPCF